MIRITSYEFLSKILFLSRLISPSEASPASASVKRLVRQPQLCGQVLERSPQRHSASVGTDIDGEEMCNPLAGGTDIALLEPGAQAHDLPCQHRHECFGSLRIAAELVEHLGLRIEANGGSGPCYGVTVISG